MCNDAETLGASNSLHISVQYSDYVQYIEALVFLPQVYITTVQSCKSDIAKQGFFSERD